MRSTATPFFIETINAMQDIENDKAAMRVDLVLPAYNPPANWEKNVVSNYKELCSRFPSCKFALYITTDGSVRGFEPKVIDYLNKKLGEFTLVDYPDNQGKGFALRKAVSQCTGDYVVYIDYDFPYTFDSISKVLDSLRDGADVVIAARSESYQQNLPLIRKFLSRVSHFLNRNILNLPFEDTQGGMKGFNKVGKEIFLKTTINTFLFDTQLIYLAVRSGVNVRKVNAEIRSGLKVSVMGMKTVFTELKNIFAIRKHK